MVLFYPPMLIQPQSFGGTLKKSLVKKRGAIFVPQAGSTTGRGPGTVKNGQAPLVLRW